MNEILRQLLIIVGSVAGILLMMYLKEQYSKIKSDRVKDLVDDAVKAAEQVYRDETGAGALKKDWVVDHLTELGVKASFNLINILIESAVLSLKN